MNKRNYLVSMDYCVFFDSISEYKHSTGSLWRQIEANFQVNSDL